MSIPYTFSPSTKAKSAEVNANFDELDSRTQSKYQLSGTGAGSISAAGASAWTDITTATLSLITDAISTVIIGINGSLQNNSTTASGDFKVVHGVSLSSTIHNDYVTLTGVALPLSGVVVLTHVPAGTATIKLQFRSSSTATATSTNSGGNTFEILAVIPES